MSEMSQYSAVCVEPACRWRVIGKNKKDAEDLLRDHTRIHQVHEKWDEIRVVNETTGGAKGSKPARFDLVPTGPMFELAKHYGKGAEKYEPNNWRKGVDWSLNYAAIQRHIQAWWGGEPGEEPEDYDAEGNLHLVSVMWHCAALLEYMHTHPELDDRPKSDS